MGTSGRDNVRRKAASGLREIVDLLRRAEHSYRESHSPYGYGASMRQSAAKDIKEMMHLLARVRRLIREEFPGEGGIFPWPKRFQSRKPILLLNSRSELIGRVDYLRDRALVLKEKLEGVKPAA